ncbi:hypothetical protein J2747_001069 [Thermococcus stetteri]|nr:hypothetical protein [Thermococcus stetteri]
MTKVVLTYRMPHNWNIDFFFFLTSLALQGGEEVS